MNSTNAPTPADPAYPASGPPQQHRSPRLRAPLPAIRQASPAAPSRAAPGPASGGEPATKGTRHPSSWILLVVAALGVLAVGGYRYGWKWTGFADGTLWNWLHLVILPVVLAAMPLWLRTRQSHRRHWRTLVACLGAGLGVTVIGGYALGWTWTGFAGNTVWDWLQLVGVPFLFPIVVAEIRASGAPGPAAGAGG